MADAMQAPHAGCSLPRLSRSEQLNATKITLASWIPDQRSGKEGLQLATCGIGQKVCGKVKATSNTSSSCGYSSANTVLLPK